MKRVLNCDLTDKHKYKIVFILTKEQIKIKFLVLPENDFS